jgi:hypothetical protein
VQCCNTTTRATRHEERAKGGNGRAQRKPIAAWENEGKKLRSSECICVAGNEPIALQIGNVIKWRKRFQFETSASDVRVKKPLLMS